MPIRPPAADSEWPMSRAISRIDHRSNISVKPATAFVVILPAEMAYSMAPSRLGLSPTGEGEVAPDSWLSVYTEDMSEMQHIAPRLISTKPETLVLGSFFASRSRVSSAIGSSIARRAAPSPQEHPKLG